MQALSEIDGRFPATEGERAMLHAVRERLPEGAPSKIEGFVGHSNPPAVRGLHVLLLLGGGIVGLFAPTFAAVFCGVVTLSLIGEGTGRFALLRHLFPKAASYNLVVHRRSPAELPPPLGAVVITAPVDVPAFRPHRRRWTPRRPFQALFSAAMLLDVVLLLQSMSDSWGPVLDRLHFVALAVLGVSVLVLVVLHRLGQGSDSASGPAALIELLRRLEERPVPGVDVWVAFTGCGHAFQEGMHAFLTLHRQTLPEPCLVVALDEPARPPLRAAIAEGALLSQHHRPTGPALVERMRWAGVVVPPVDYGAVTNARAALVAGYRSLGLVGGDGPDSPEAVDRTVDVLENLLRWYGEDLARVAHVRPALEELARATAQARERQDERRRRRGREQPPKAAGDAS